MNENDKQAEAWPCKIIESDFEQDTITVQMQNKDYFVSGGIFWLSMHKQAEPVALNIIRKWPDGFADRLQHVWLDVISFIPNVKLYDLQRVLAEFGFTMEVYEGTPSAQPVQLAGAQGEAVDLRELFERLLFGTYAGKDSYYNDEQIKHGCSERAQELVDVAKRMNIALYTAPPAVAINQQLLEALKRIAALQTYARYEGEEDTLYDAKGIAQTAIAAAEAEKAKGGV